MTTDIELLPLYAELQGHPKLEIIKHYARANVEHYVKELQEEVARARGLWGDAETLCHKLYDQNAAKDAEIERLAEALRELVEVFSESGMYDEEVFAKARAALDQEVGNG